MPTLSTSVDFEVYCATCGAGMCNNTEVTTTRTRHEPCLRIDACDDCVSSARAEGIAEGREEVQDEYQAQIDNLTTEIAELKTKLSQQNAA